MPNGRAGDGRRVSINPAHGQRSPAVTVPRPPAPLPCLPPAFFFLYIYLFSQTPVSSSRKKSGGMMGSILIRGRGGCKGSNLVLGEPGSPPPKRCPPPNHPPQTFLAVEAHP